jgi:hypothetical protein
MATRKKIKSKAKTKRKKTPARKARSTVGKPRTIQKKVAKRSPRGATPSKKPQPQASRDQLAHEPPKQLDLHRLALQRRFRQSSASASYPLLQPPFSRGYAARTWCYAASW